MSRTAKWFAHMSRTAKCWCGCGKKVARRFKPGHDAKFHSRVQQVVRGDLQISKATKTMPPEAKRSFRDWVKTESS